VVTTLAKISRRPEFDRDLKPLVKRYLSLGNDLNVFINTQLVLLHKQKIDNRGIVLINNLDIEEHKIFKAVKFACKSIHGRGAAFGIRLTYAYFEEAYHIEFIQIYFKADDENEDREKMKNIYVK
jgi:hypothetical protein